MARVKGPLKQLLDATRPLVTQARVELSETVTCGGLLLGIGSNREACNSVLGQIDQVEKKFSELEKRRLFLVEANPASVREATKIANLAKLYVEQLQYYIREAVKDRPMPRFMQALSDFTQRLTEVLATFAAFGAGVAVSVVEGAASGLGLGGVLVVGLLAYAYFGGGRGGISWQRG